jgi:hypothetical protein
MALLALDLLARIVAMRIDAGPPFLALFTLWLSIMAAVGLASSQTWTLAWRHDPNAACGFPALRSPVCFTSRVMGPIVLGRLSALASEPCSRCAAAGAGGFLPGVPLGFGCLGMETEIKS